MNADDIYAEVMRMPAEDLEPLSRLRRDQLFGSVWNRPGLGIRDRRLVSLVCVTAAVDVPAMDAHVYACLASGDFTVDELNETTLHVAVYLGWPRASQLEQSVRQQWQRIHDERGLPTPPMPVRTVEDLGITDPVARLEDGIACFREVNLIDAPSQDSPYFFAGILSFVFGHLWRRPGLSRRDRRLITVPCVAVSDAIGPIWSHVTSAVASGDVAVEEMTEIIIQIAAYAGDARATVLEQVLAQWQTRNA